MEKILRHRIFSLLAILLIISLASVSAQPPAKGGKGGKGGFNPDRFQAEMEQYITTHAALSPREAAKFFPVYRQMTKKMRMLFDEMRRWHMVAPVNNEKCAEAIRKQDEIDIQLKQLQQEYHAKFMLVLPAKKVLEVIKAEEQFHREAFKKMHK